VVGGCGGTVVVVVVVVDVVVVVIVGPGGGRGVVVAGVVTVPVAGVAGGAGAVVVVAVGGATTGGGTGGSVPGGGSVAAGGSTGGACSGAEPSGAGSAPLRVVTRRGATVELGAAAVVVPPADAALSTKAPATTTGTVVDSLAGVELRAGARPAPAAAVVGADVGGSSGAGRLDKGPRHTATRLNNVRTSPAITMRPNPRFDSRRLDRWPG
jgi:hypothetical protein